MLEDSSNQPNYSSDIISHIANEYCSKWFDDPSEILVDMVIYPVVGITVEQLRTIIKLEWPKNQENWKGMLAAADVHDMSLIDFTSHVTVNKEGSRISLPTEVMRELKFNGPSLIVAIPVNDALETNPISVVVSLFRLHRGNAIAWSNPIRLRYNGKTNAQWFAQSIGKTYSSDTDGPFDSPTMAKDIAETLSKLFSKQNPVTERVLFSLELFTKANESTRDSLRVRIFQYWSAIETLCDTNNCSDLLRHLFNGRTDSAQENIKKLFKDSRTLRHNVTHKGHNPSACPHTLERYLQVVFLDMMRKILNLNYEGYVEQFINRHGTNWFQEIYKKT